MIETLKVTGVGGVTCRVGGSPCMPRNVRLWAASDGVTGVSLLIYDLFCIYKKRAIYIYMKYPKRFEQKKGVTPVTRCEKLPPQRPPHTPTLTELDKI
jgi:hypothetical protein